jgi:hypothetical protein
VLTGLALFFVLVVSAGPATQDERDAFQQTKIGHILVEGSDGSCARMKFDNITGSVARDHRNCDPNGYPIPSATIQRLNAISQAFSGK